MLNMQTIWFAKSIVDWYILGYRLMINYCWFMNEKVYLKYLKRAKPCTLEPLEPENKFSGAVVIPALAEYDFLPATLTALAQAKPEKHSVAVVIVINNSHKTPADKIKENAKMLDALRSGNKNFCGGLKPGIELFWIDASSTGKEISAKGGVGEARKLGMDRCLELFPRNRLNENILFCLDADTLVTPNYLEAVFEYFRHHPETYSATLSFAHRSGETASEHAAIEAYEEFMHYYVNGLKHAGSPYDFYALGSAISCRAEAYVRAGGMRARNGGEDFYFMQAVSKFGHCGIIKEAQVFPSARPSDRVPFGTGPKIREIVNGQELLFYNPEIFEILKKLISTVNSLDNPVDFESLPAIIEEHCGVEAAEYFRSNDFAAAWEKIYRHTRHEIEYLRKAFHTWFDAFRTLKFVHFCENNYPNLHRIKPD